MLACELTNRKLVHSTAQYLEETEVNSLLEVWYANQSNNTCRVQPLPFLSSSSSSSLSLVGLGRKVINETETEREDREWDYLVIKCHFYTLHSLQVIYCIISAPGYTLSQRKDISVFNPAGTLLKHFSCTMWISWNAWVNKLFQM